MQDDEITIDDMSHRILCSIDFGQRTIEDTFIDPIIQLSFEIRSRLTCDDCRDRMRRDTEDDIRNIREADTEDFLITAGEALEAWESKASDHDLIGYTDEGFYFIAVLL